MHRVTRVAPMIVLVFALVAGLLIATIASPSDRTGVAVAAPLTPTPDPSAATPTPPIPVAEYFVSPLSGEAERPDSVDTKATGNAVFQLSFDGASLEYKLITANILDVLQAHIHCGGPEDAGPVVAFLYPSGPPPVLIPGRSDGILAHGTITQANVIARPDSAACPGGVASFDDLVEKMRVGHTYTNVHTANFTGGEIRGQIMPAGPR